MEGWILYPALGAAASLAMADLFIKAAGGKIARSLALLLYGSCTFLTGLGWVLWRYSHGIEQPVQVAGVLAALGVGVAFSLSTTTTYITLGSGAPVSVAIPFIRMGGLVLASLAGLTLLQEPLTWRYVVGMLLTISGVYLIVVTRKGQS